MIQTNDFPECPHVSEALITHLESLYPEQCPSLRMSDREIWVMVGQRNIVRALRARYEEQESR